MQGRQFERLERRALMAAVSSVYPSSLGIGAGVNTHVQVAFASSMTAGSITSSTFQLLDGSTPVSARISYNPNNKTATIDPAAPLAYNKSYSVVVKGGSTGVKDSSAGTLASDYTWSFKTAADPTTGPGGPILVITKSSNPYSTYYPEILRAEGLNAFATADISTVSAANLANYKLVLLSEMTLTATQVSTISSWVTGGGKLVAMRPDKQLAGLLGLTDTGATISDTYLDVDNTTAVGAGITATSMQYHSTADRYTLNGATKLADLFSNSTTSINNPAVTIKTVGSNGGQAAAFVFDLAKSIIQTRQGNPLWSGQERDGLNPTRSNDLFFGGNSAPDWVDLTKVQIPQADEQQRLLANMITDMTAPVLPMPRFWYFPNGAKAQVIMTGDDHNGGGTAGRWNNYLSAGTSGGQAIRGSSYVFPSSISDSSAASYVAQGFEPGLHIDITSGPVFGNSGDIGVNWTSYSALDSLYTSQLNTYNNTFTSIPTPTTVRTHAIVWSDYDSQPRAEFNHRIRLDTNYYYWPDTWVLDRPGMFTGSGIPMRFAKLDGSMIDVYQATTQITDESGQTEPKHITTLLDNATGAQGYYGAFTVNAHTDGTNSTVSDAVITSAKAHNIPVITADAMMTWSDGRNGSSFQNLAWDANALALSFDLSLAVGASGLQAMVPMTAANRTLQSIKINGGNVAFTQQTIKGVAYAFFPASSGSVVASYAADTTAPTVTANTPGDGASSVTTLVQPTVTFSEDVQPASISFIVKDAANNVVPGTVSYDSTTRTATFKPTSALATSTTYTATVSAAKDLSNNVMTGSSSWSFVTSAASATTYTIFSPSSTPNSSFVSDSSVELGVKFKADVDGFITGIRFYKGVGSSGTHTGSLWSSAGSRLSIATFSGETSSGWQQVQFATPVAITAGTTYVASYHANNGYAADNNYFASQVDSGPLHALASSASGGNGVYSYGTGSVFPTSSYQASNYWVDAIFSPGSVADTTAPTVVTKVPAPNATNVALNSTIQAVFSEALQAGTAVIVAKDAAQNIVAGASSYDANTKTLTFTPASQLAGSTTYTVTVSGAKDPTGNTMTATTWSFTTLTPDVTPPAITSTTPANSATNVSTGTAISAVFSEAIQSGTAVVTFKDAAQNIIAGTTSYNAGAQTVTFTPSSALAGSTTYTVTVTGAKDASNNTMSPASWSFTTAAVDVTAPTITATSPSSGASNVPVNSAITATFSEDVQANSIVITVKDSSQNTVAGTTTYDAATKTAKFTPSSSLLGSTGYTVTVSGAKDASNNVMSAASFSFTTAVVTTTNYSFWTNSTTPATTNNYDGTPIELGMKFNSSASGTVTGIRFYKGSQDTGTHIGNLWSSTGSLLARATFSGESASGWQTVNFSSPISITPGTTYVASYFAASGRYSADTSYFATGRDSGPIHALASSESSNGLYRYTSATAFPNSSYSATNYWVDIVFSTAAPADTTAPTVTNRAPANGATNVAISAAITATLSEDIQPGSATFLVKDSAQNVIAGVTTYDAATKTATFTPSAPLSGSTTYTVTLSGATDLSDNVMVPATWSFTTVAVDVTPPTVTANSPANGATSVSIGTNITATFSEAIVSGSAVVTVKDAAQNVIPGATSYNASTQTVTFVPASALASSASYTVTVTGAKDASNNVMSPASWSFTTAAADVTAPAVTTTSPASGATGVATGSTIVATFSEAVQSNTITLIVKDAGQNIIAGSTSYDSATNTVTFTPASALNGSTTYTVSISGAQDLSSNTMTPTSWSFTTAIVIKNMTQTAVTDFSAGATTNTTITNTAGGEIILTPAFNDDFTGSALSPAWNVTAWTSGSGTSKVTFASGVVSIGRNQAKTAQTFTNTGLEGSISFASAQGQQFGLATDLQATAGNFAAVFTTRTSNTTLFARVNNNGTLTDVNLGAIPSGFHLYAIKPVSTGYAFFIDGALKTTIAKTLPTNQAMSVVLASQTGGKPIQADYVRVPSYASTGTFVSSVLDAGQTANWGALSYNSTVPTGAGILVEVSTGNTATPDGTWSAWSSVASGSNISAPAARYIRYRVTFTTSDATVTPTFSDITISYT